ncbi:MAG: sigma-70 family RNA polymerase sigma factor [Planctomycetota bacterium]|nr:sigma-70 family RNA polymerase sigma factor [Planctomycetota bacterium]
MLDDPDKDALVEATDEDRPEVLGRIFDAQRARFLKMIAVRMHPRVRARLDASDIVQEAYVEIVKNVDEYVREPRMPFFLWMRRIVGQRLMKAHRFHLDAKRRDARQEQKKIRHVPDASTAAMADLLHDGKASPLSVMARDDAHDRLVRMLDDLSETDREVIAMRHFEGLSNEEVAAELGLGKHAASKRYLRALDRLKRLIDEVSGG